MVSSRITSSQMSELRSTHPLLSEPFSLISFLLIRFLSDRFLSHPRISSPPGSFPLRLFPLRCILSDPLRPTYTSPIKSRNRSLSDCLMFPLRPTYCLLSNRSLSDVSLSDHFLARFLSCQARHVMAWHNVGAGGVARDPACGTVWNGTARYGMAWHGIASRGGHGPSGATGIILTSRGVDEVFTPMEVRFQVKS